MVEAACSTSSNASASFSCNQSTRPTVDAFSWAVLEDKSFHFWHAFANRFSAKIMFLRCIGSDVSVCCHAVELSTTITLPLSPLDFVFCRWLVGGCVVWCSAMKLVGLLTMESRKSRSSAVGADCCIGDCFCGVMIRCLWNVISRYAMITVCMPRRISHHKISLLSPLFPLPSEIGGPPWQFWGLAT